MDYEIPRGRSPFQSHSTHISPQPSPQRYHDAIPQLGLDPAVNSSTFSTGRFAQAEATSSLQYTSPYPNSSAQSQVLPQNIAADSILYQNSQLNQGAFRQHQPLAFQNNQTFPFLLNSKEVPYSNDGSNMHSDFSNTNFALDPTFDSTQQNINPASLSRMPSHASTPPHLLSPEHQHSPGQPGSPASTQGQFYTPQHSRHQSLDPASAAYPQGGPTDWQGMSFQQHRRAPSDHSELSSNAPSPFLPHAELGEPIETNHSPMIGAQHDGLNAFGIEDFSINDQQQAQVSPGHSPYMSPRLMAQPNQGLGMGSEFMLQQGMQPLMLGPGPEIYTTQAEDSFHSMPHMHDRNHSIPSDMGQADQFPAPTINIEPAPVSRQVSFEPETNNLGDTLSPPARARGRSKSDPHVSRSSSRPVSRSASPAGRSPSPSLGALSDDASVRSLSPGMGPPSRESSPGPGSGRVEKNRRQSTSSIPTRDYILDLADPSRPNASSSPASTRIQKHPATFQCSLCPKRFTRAYNLRSHLRTHTDERPFVCTVCGKAFARQHDRKRHEGLHSGEKKFVCRGDLGSGNLWGCGRKFARADALGRHFRSEAGRICIKPLLDEEAAERARNRLLEQQQQHGQFGAGSLQPVQQPMMMNMDASGGGGFALPAALLTMYPALNNIDWKAMSQGDDPGDLSDVGMVEGEFDANSGGDFAYDDSDIGEGYVTNNGLAYGGGGQGAW